MSLKYNGPISDEIQTYYEALPEERKLPFENMLKAIDSNLPSGFEFRLSYGLPTFCVPLSLYPAGYHCKKGEPLPFISIASQKNFMALYHMGIYADSQTLEWFQEAYPLHSPYKLDMGKSCVRFKKLEAIPYGLLEELAQKYSPSQWVALYEKSFSKNSEK